MTTYHLGEFVRLPWVKIMRGFKVGLVLFGAFGFATVIYSTFASGADPLAAASAFVGFLLVIVIFALFVLFGLLIKVQASNLIIDEHGVRLQYERGRDDSFQWDNPRLRIHGRRTEGVEDTVSQGKPLCSVYGRFGGFSESFIPISAYAELVSRAEQYGIKCSQRDGKKPGWFLFTLSRGG